MIENILLTLLVLLLCAKLLGALFERFGMDSSLGELLTGIIFGVSVLKLVDPAQIAPFAIIGSVLILFIAGLKQEDITEVYKDPAPIALGLLLLVVTGGAMTAFFYFVPPYFGLSLSLIQSFVLGLAFAIIDIGVPAKILISKGVMSLPVGKVAVRSAIVNIVAGLLAFTIVTVLMGGQQEALFKIGGIALFILVVVLLLMLFSRFTNSVLKMHVNEAEFSLAIILVLALAYMSEVIGFSSVLGAFIAGVVIARIPFSETRSFSDKIKSVSFGLFVPLFFVWFGLEINLQDIMGQWKLALLIFAAYVILRFTITYLFIKARRLDQPLLVSASMLSVDVESLVIILVAMNLLIFTDKTPLTLFAPSVFLSTLLVVVLVAIISRMNRKKNTVA